MGNLNRMTDIGYINDEDEIVDGDYHIVCYSGAELKVKGNGKNYSLTLSDNGSEFTFTEKGSGVWEISPTEAKEMCLDVYGCSNADGTKLIVYPRNNSAAQRFKLEKTDCGYRFLTAASGYRKYIALSADGKSVIQSSQKDGKTVWALCSE